MKNIIVDRNFKNSTFPKKIELGNKSFYIVKNKKQWLLVSTICPHMGGTVIIDESENCFTCPLHNWKFDIDNGECLNARNEQLSSYVIKEEGPNLVAELPKSILNDEIRIESNNKKIDLNFEVKLHSHSSLEIVYKDFSILTDPWIEGPAFMGSWMHYPKPITAIEDIQANIIWISHEHSDHFHIPTLEKIDKNIPVFFPDFPNRRIEYKLKELGFINVNPMPFGKTFTVYDEIKLTCFEPSSLWNDSIALFEFGDLKFLNLNDAGLNERIADLVYPVDIIASAFTWGASGFPLTWEHLSQYEKEKIMKDSNNGMLEMLKSSIEMYGAKYLIPYAGHFSLWHPDHKEYIDISIKNTVNDVLNYFKNNDDVRVVDLLPGENYQFKENRFKRVYKNRSRIYKKEILKKYVSKQFDWDTFQKYYPDYGDLSVNKIVEYFLRFNKTNEILFCENITFKIEIIDKPLVEDLYFQVKDSKIFRLAENLNYDLKIGIPGEILNEIIDMNISWDEAHIGYWCRLDRSPDTFHPNFWRMLQAPYFRKEITVNKTINTNDEELGTKSIEFFLEKYGDSADRIFRRYGLFCFGCQRAGHESVIQGGIKHGLNEKKISRLIEELKYL